MAITRTIWKNWFRTEDVPAWPCPTCNKGILIGGKKDIKVYENVTSAAYRRDSDWEPYWISGHFTGVLKCNNEKCEERVVVSGEMAVDEAHEYDTEFQGWNFSYIEVLKPQIFIPSLNIFQFHKDVPKQISEAIGESFKLFWIDSSSCGNKIRTIIEIIMDEQKIAKTYTSKGKRKGHSLHKRIELFKNVKVEEGELLMAIKWIGNSGSHWEHELTKDDTLDAYEILEHCITKLYEKDSQRIKILSKTINKRKRPNSTKRKKAK